MLSRAINGSAPFFPTLFGGLVLVSFHRLIVLLGFRFQKFGTLVKGSDEIVIQDGHIRREASARISSVRRTCSKISGSKPKAVQRRSNVPALKPVGPESIVD